MSHCCWHGGLEHLTSVVVESGGRGKFNVLKRERLAPFMDYENVSQRIHALKQHDDLGSRAGQLAAAFGDGAKY